MQFLYERSLSAAAIALMMIAGSSLAIADDDSESTPSRRTDSQPRLLRKIEYGNYGSKYLRLGDLDGDGLVDLLLVQGTCPNDDRGRVQEERLQITCLTALDLEGNLLWQSGKPDPENIVFFSDYPVQIYDIDGDGKNEVVYIADEQNVLTIAEGASGKTIKTVPLAGGHDSLLFADLRGVGRATDLVVKDRYRHFWVYDDQFKLRWSKATNTGHYPIEYDFDGDGRDELLCGYTLYDGDGNERWSHPEFPQHNDAVDIADMDGDGRAEIAIASSENAYLLDADGKILFMRPMGHCQHAQIGKFRQDMPGLQVFFLDRLPGYTNATNPGYTNESVSNACLFSRSGELLWNRDDNIWVAASMKVDNWTGNPNEQFVMLYSRGFAAPGLFDGEGREIATFPFPPAISEPGGGRDGADLYEDYYTQHVSCWGDEREEILVFNHKALYVFTNAALWQRPRLYNNNYYPGRL